MPNPELIHASICAGAGFIGLVLILISLRRQNFGNAQPNWSDDELDSGSENDIAPKPRSRFAFGIMIALIALTGLASIVTVALAYRS